MNKKLQTFLLGIYNSATYIILSIVLIINTINHGSLKINLETLFKSLGYLLIGVSFIIIGFKLMTQQKSIFGICGHTILVVYTLLLKDNISIINKVWFLIFQFGMIYFYFQFNQPNKLVSIIKETKKVSQKVIFLLIFTIGFCWYIYNSCLLQKSESIKMASLALVYVNLFIIYLSK